MSDRTAVACNHCGHMYALPREFLGKKATCKSCGEKFIAAETSLPRSTPSAAAAPAPVAPAPPAQPSPAMVAPLPSRPTPSVVLPSKREVPIVPPARVADSGVITRKSPRGTSLDDSVLSWLDEADADETPVRPRVVTTADICEPGQRQQLRGPHAAVQAEPQQADSAKH